MWTPNGRKMEVIICNTKEKKKKRKTWRNDLPTMDKQMIVIMWYNEWTVMILLLIQIIDGKTAKSSIKCTRVNISDKPCRIKSINVILYYGRPGR